MSRKPITPAKGGLFLLGLSTILFMGVPNYGGDAGPSAPISGYVRDSGGTPLGGIRVALFDADGLELLEWTRTDQGGSFALQETSPAYHLFVAPDEARDLVGTWLLNREPVRFDEYDIVLEQGLWIEVTARDEAGRPLEGAEIRTYGPDESPVVCLARTLTGADGTAHVLVPTAAHIGVLGQGLGLCSSWAFDLHAEDGDELDFVLPAATLIQGRVADPDGRPLEGAIVSSWDQREGQWHWNGYQCTDPFGDFDILGSPAGTSVRALDPDQNHLPLELSLEGDALDAPTFFLPPGEPLDLHLARAENPSTTRIRSWSEATGTWGWAVRPSALGELQIHVSEHHGLITEPGRASQKELFVWDRDLESAGSQLVLGTD